ncbi:MAG: vitamin K epoxide reductase family protein [Chloroflexota bacterium]
MTIRDVQPQVQLVDSGRQSLNFKRIAVLAVVGLAVSAYLTWIHWFPSSTFCTGVGDCEAVNSSPYATLGSIPIAALGMLMYISVLAMAWVGKRNERQQADKAGLAIFGFSLLGVLFSGYLTYIELYVIHAICPWCVASAIIVSLIFLLSIRSFLDWMRG